ncbi:hypothetical protein BpHYR1_021931 [Brachionus plicatilis]|uniref:Uncharacterized protein n=1 Tax=Brachionus plicatilis TaxID=10195 RepID=A0A3M7RRF5_BRAPC|nr:hypothetical protein BpHYR1_021931 [Brachionus plicatilis]
MYTYTNGHHSTNNELFMHNNYAIQIKLFIDDFDLFSQLGDNRKKKMTVVYYQIEENGLDIDNGYKMVNVKGSISYIVADNLGVKLVVLSNRLITIFCYSTTEHEQEKFKDTNFDKPSNGVKVDNCFYDLSYFN